MKRMKVIHAALALLPLLLATRHAAAAANDELLVAARRGDVEQLAQALEQGADADTATEQGVSALMYAAASGHPEAMQRLLDARARVDVRVGNGISALRIAVAAGSVDAARRLLAAGADRDDMDANGSRLLFAAAGNGSIELLDLFLAPGEDVNYKRKAGGYTALDAALEGQRWAAAEHLLAHGATLSASIVGREQALLKLLELEPVVKLGTMSLVQTVELPSPALLRAVLAQGARTDFTDADGNTLLMLAAKRHHVTALGQDQTSLTRLIFRPAQKSTESTATARRLEAAKLLLTAMADPNAADHIGNTPLLHATRSGDAELVAMLIAAGASVDARNEAGNAPLLLAAQFGMHEIAATLLRAHADAGVTDNEGHTPLELARAGGHEAVVNLLEAARLN